MPFKNAFDKGWRKNISRLFFSQDKVIFSSKFPVINQWLNNTISKLLLPWRYQPPIEEEFPFVIDDENKDRLFRSALEYNRKLLRHARRQYLNHYKDPELASDPSDDDLEPGEMEMSGRGEFNSPGKSAHDSAWKDIHRL